ncbi:MAG TPA: hypothetical protein VMD28_00880, partial [Acidimicrobiales bacterium]|nr:hypothetical protein [Acidimicrobiales bacterium]
HPPSGCVFHPRCPAAVERCRVEVPRLTSIGASRAVACHRSDEMLAGSLELRGEVHVDELAPPGAMVNL